MIRYEQRTGYPRSPHLFTGIEFQGMVMIEQMIEQEQVALEKDMVSVLSVGLSVKRGV